MLFKKLFLRGFRSFKDDVTFDLSTKSLDKNVVLIGGTNGTGKSNIMKAIKTLFYGTNDNVMINRKNPYINRSIIKDGGECTISLEYLDDDNSLVVARKNRVIWNGKIDKVDFSVKKDGFETNISEDIWRDQIENKMPESVFEFFFFSGEEIGDMGLNNPKELTNSIEKVIGLDNINKLLGILENLKKQKQQAITATTKNKDIITKQYQVDTENTELTEMKDQLETLNDNLLSKKQERKVLREEYTRLFGVKPEDRLREQEINEEIGGLKKEISDIDKKINDYLRDIPIALISKHKDVVEKNLQTAEDYRSYTETLKKHEDTKNKIINGMYKPKAFLWGKELSDDEIKLIDAKLDEILGENQVEKPVINITEDDIKSIRESFNRIGTIKKNMVELIKGRETLIQNRNLLEKELREISVISLDQDRQQKMMDELSKFDSDIAQLENDIQKLEVDIANKQRSFDLNSQQLDRMQSSLEEANDKKKEKEQIEKYINALLSFKDKLRKEKIGTLQEQMTRILKRLRIKDEVKDIIIDRDSFEVKFIGRDDQELDKAIFSQGEQVLISLSLIYGLQKTSGINMPIIIDAPLSKLDNIHKINFLNNFIPEVSKQVICITKDDIYKGDGYYNILSRYVDHEYTLEYQNEYGYSIVKDGFLLKKFENNDIVF